MKKIIVLILSVLMIASLCVPIAGCNGSSKPKPADELFFSVSDSGIMERLASSMGLSADIKELLQNTDKNEKVVFSLGISDLSFAGMPILQSPIKTSFDGIIDRDGNTAGAVNWSYMTDNLNIYAALGKGCAAVKFDDLTDYIDLTPLFENINTDNGQSAELVAAVESAVTEFGKIIVESIDKTKLTEKSEEITVDGNTVKVRAISYTLAGEELAAFIEKIVSEADKNASVTEILEKLDIADAFKDVKLTASENDKISIVRYFEVNEPRGFDIDVNFEKADIDVKIASRTNLTKDTDYADIEVNVTGETDSGLTAVSGFSLKGLYKRENNGSFLCEFTVGSGDSGSLSVNLGSLRLSGTTTDTAEGKRTDITMTVGISGAVLQIPCAVTVRKSDKENVDVAFEMSINIPSMLSVKLTAEEKISLTDEAVNMPGKDEIKSEAPDDAKEKLEEKLENTFELFEMFDLIFGGDYDDDYDYGDYSDLDI